MTREFHNKDCMAGMAKYPNNYFDLAIVDPPYNLRRFQNDRPSSRLDKYGKMRNWNNAALPQNYFSEMFRISKIQIVWGGNYFDLPKTQGWIFWDKHQPAPSFAAGELAWTSIDKPLIKIDLPYFGTVGADIKRIHPAQKPVALYRWLLKNYAEPGQIILDTHVGSASSLIACEMEGFEYVGFEIDEDYYKAAMERIKRFRMQPDMFSPQPKRTEAMQMEII